MTSDDLTPVIVNGARTPFGRFRGGLASFTAPDLGALAIRAALTKSGVPADAVEHVIVGQVVQAGSGQGPARQASVNAGIGFDVPTVTVNKLCLSGLTAVIDAARMIRLGEASVVVAAGQESMTNAPHLLQKSREPFGLGDRPLIDSLNWDGLIDPFDGSLMGEATDDGNAARGIRRERQDAFSLSSHERALAAQAAGRFDEEIVPVSVPQRRGEPVVISADEGPRADTTLERLAALKPVFRPNGTVTAGSSSPLTDGAAALVVMSKAAARAAGLTWLAEIGAAGQVAGPDRQLHSQPSRAIQQALARADRSVADLSVIEINEAFASVVLQSADDLGVDPSVVNLDGGAIAIGHPIGASGARLALHLALSLHRAGSGLGAAALCGGGGQGDALLLTA